MPAKLRDIAGEIEAGTDELQFYIHRVTGETVLVEDDAVEALREGQTPELMNIGEEGLEDCRRVAEDKTSFIPLPRERDMNAYEVMVDFALSLPSTNDRITLERALNGKGAFRRFQDTARQLGLLEEWYAFKQAALEAFAREFLEEEGIPFEA